MRKFKTDILAEQLHQDLVTTACMSGNLAIGGWHVSGSPLVSLSQIRTNYKARPHICLDKRTMHSSLLYQRDQPLEVAFLLRQSKTVPTTVNTSVSATDSDRSLSPGSSHVYIRQHREQFGSEINLLKTSMPHRLLMVETFCLR